MSKAIIVKIDLATPPEEYIKRHLGKQSEETKAAIEKVVQEKKLVQNAKDSLKEKTRQKTTTLNNLFTQIHAQGETGMPKQEVIDAMMEMEAVKSSSGATLKLKKMVATELVGYELKVTKTHYFIVKAEN
jgi:hypothetical protein